MFVEGAEGMVQAVRCDAGHSVFLSRPGFVVDLVRRAAGEVVGEEEEEEEEEEGGVVGMVGWGRWLVGLFV